MLMTKANELKLAEINKEMAPWTGISTMGISNPRKVSGNLYRHQEATRIILMDYGFFDRILHKAAVVHDCVEDIEGFNHRLIIDCDHDGAEVYKLVLEVSRRAGESKPDFLSRIYNEGSDRACLIKSADRIANLSECQFLFDRAFISKLCDESERYVIPAAERVCLDMVREISDLIGHARKLLPIIEELYKKGELK